MVTTRPRPAVEDPKAPASGRFGRLRFSTNAVLGLVLAAALAVAAFVTSGGTDLSSNTWTEIVLTVTGATMAIALLVIGARGLRWGLVTFGCFAALAALTAASILWSVVPDKSWVEANRTLSYLAVFGGALALARLLPERWSAVVGAIVVLTTVIGFYALLAKVFPATFDASDTFGRLRVPFDYFNAAGLIAALGLPACLWAGARRARTHALRALAVPAIAVLATVVALSYSRGALLVALLGVAVWFATVPLRLRGALVLALGLIGGAVLSAYALHTHALTHDLVPLATRSSAGHRFGVVLVVVLSVLTAAGIAASVAVDRTAAGAGHAPANRQGAGARRRAAPGGRRGRARRLLARADGRDLTQLLDPHQRQQRGAEHAVATGAARQQPRQVLARGPEGRRHHLLHGAGAMGYGTAATRYTSDPNVVPHAHSFVVQTFADFGLIGIAVIAALLGAWALAVKRTLSGGSGAELASQSVVAPRAESSAADERAGLLTLLCVVVVFGAHSAIDWTWFIPGTALPALLAAGWLAGRGPIDEPIGRAPKPRSLIASPGIAAAVLAIVAVTLLCVWQMWQPLRSADALSASTAALVRGDRATAIADARTAARVDPAAVDPLWQLAELDSGGGDQAAARREYLRAVGRQPENPQTWLALGEYELGRGQPGLALGPLQRALLLDRGSAEAAGDLAQAHQLLVNRR